MRPTGSIMVGDACSGGRRSLELRSVGDGMPVARAYCTHAAVAVCLFASGCLGTGPSEATKAQWKPTFVGTWDL